MINFVLKDRFRAFTGELRGEFPTIGDGQKGEARASFIRKQGKNRWSLDGSASHRARILESDREIPTNSDDDFLSPLGNVEPIISGTQIDPALSALAGTPVVLAGVPASAISSVPALEDFAQSGGNQINSQHFRTLAGTEQTLSVGAAYALALSSDIGATLSANLDLAKSDHLLGVGEIALNLPAMSSFSPFASDTLLRKGDSQNPLRRAQDQADAEFGLVVNGETSGWRWSANVDYVHSTTDTDTDRYVDVSVFQFALNQNDPTFNPFAPINIDGALAVERTHSRRDVFSTELTASRQLFDLPAGPVLTSTKFGFITTDFFGEAAFEGVTTRADLWRNVVTGQLDVELPLIATPGWFGDLRASAGAEISDVSDFGSVTTYSGSLYWRPATLFSLLSSYERKERAPTLNELGDPLTTTPNVRVFDYIGGGNHIG